MVQHFQRITTEPQVDRSITIQKITRHIPRALTVEHNQNLNKPISIEEVTQAVQEMPNTKLLALMDSP